MSRDQRADDNWALLYAQDIAIQYKKPLLVIFCLVGNFLGATERQYDFMIRGLRETGKYLRGKQIPLILCQGDPDSEITKRIEQENVGFLVTDFDPLRIKRQWKEKIRHNISIPIHEVDAHNIVPCRIVSDKKEYGAYTIRPKINRVLSRYLTDFPDLLIHPFSVNSVIPSLAWEDVEYYADRTVRPVELVLPGSDEAKKQLNLFIRNRLNNYDAERNDPNKHAQSGLSPYLHFGQIAPQRAAWEVSRSAAPESAKETFLEELIVRRELADNFCFHEPAYDSMDAFPRWAKETLNEHESDPRRYLYSLEELETARTHDPLWNASQIQLIREGKMHGYLRMYWAKKILEWSPAAHIAMEYAIYLNDRYSLDGRDPNGYAGIAWSIGGVHDRAWPGRPVFGKIRYMSDNGAKSKFNAHLFEMNYLP